MFLVIDPLALPQIDEYKREAGKKSLLIRLTTLFYAIIK